MMLSVDDIENFESFIKKYYGSSGRRYKYQRQMLEYLYDVFKKERLKVNFEPLPDELFKI